MAEIKNGAQLQTLVDSPKLTVVIFFKAENKLLSSVVPENFAEKVTLAHCNLNTNPWAETQYQITSDPTFIAFLSGKLVRRMAGIKELLASLPELAKAIKVPDASSSGGGGGGGSGGGGGASGSSTAENWMGAAISAKNYGNITGSVEKKGLDILNANTAKTGPQVLFEGSKPSGKQADGIESDTDEQLMLFVPFKAVVKLHSIQITSLVNEDEDEDDDEAPSRPRTIKIFANTHHILGFDEAEEREVTQTVELKSSDWNKDGTAVINTKFVKFQNVTTVTLFFVDVQREGGEKVRIDRLRLVGEVMFEKLDMSKLKQQDQE